jgi:PAS domain S-box-containing protein
LKKNHHAMTEGKENYSEQFQQIFENSMIGMSLIDLKGNWKRANRSLCQMLGYEERGIETTERQGHHPP